MFEARNATVVIVDDESSLREALEVLITSAGYRCKAFASAQSFLENALPPAPRCLLLDLQLEDISGLELQNQLNAQQQSTPVLFISGAGSIAHAVSAMKAGAMDFLEKPFDPDRLLARVERALQASADGYNRGESAAHVAARLAGLTCREHEILTLLVRGDANKEVARLLELTSTAVETHRENIMHKLETQSLADLMADLMRVWVNHDPVG